MRAALMDLLGKGGEKFLDFDEAYARALERENYPGGDWGGVMQLGHTRAFRDNVPVGVYEDMGGIGPRTQAEQAYGRKVDNILRGANFLSRYALPAGGVTLAGKGLYDVIAALNDAEEGVV